jgi:arsenate reductase
MNLYSLLSSISEYVGNIKNWFRDIPAARKKELRKISQFISEKISKGHPAFLLFICTHNSRRSHMSQIWAQTAAIYYQLPMITCYSGGTEATSFNPRAVCTLQKAGFSIDKATTGKNPVYEVKYAEGVKPIRVFSKKYDDKFNPQTNFCAIMTCSDADAACPTVFGAAERISIPYEDPKVADDTDYEEKAYDERNRQIATEMFYLFDQVKREFI